ncbi:hypothetical protein [Robinsoniella peoriensis]
MDADRIRLFRRRKRACEALLQSVRIQSIDLNALWNTIQAFSFYPFKSRSGEKFKYSMDIKVDSIMIQDQNYVIKKSSVETAFQKVILDDSTWSDDSQLPSPSTDMYYLLPIFLRFGLMKDKTAE